jgi:hypothetical protein
VESQTAGSPTDESVKWTHLSAWNIVVYLLKEYEISISCACVRRILAEQGYVKRKPLKAVMTGKSPHRDEQFRMIAIIRYVFMSTINNPILSIDTKKKELLGNLTRNQAVFCKKGKPIEVFDHDFPNLATGKIIPHGIYDIKLNKGYVTLGNSAETADFVVDNIEAYWINFGIHLYPNADNILILCDGGGANGHRYHRFKYCLQQLVETIGVKITIVHYPPYCSKYNPIERMLFAPVHHAMKDSILTDLEQCKTIINKTNTKKGLTIVVTLNLKVYSYGMLSNKDMIDNQKIKHATILPDFSYEILF